MPPEVPPDKARLVAIYKHLLDAPVRRALPRLVGTFLRRDATCSCDHSLHAASLAHLGGAAPPCRAGSQAATRSGRGRAGGRALLRGRLRRATSRHRGREAGAAGRKESCGEGEGQTLKLPGCGLRARMLSVLPTSWQRHLGPGRRRRCGNGAARVAEPALAPARSRPEALPALASAPRPLRGRERVRGAGRPRERGPRGGGGPGARGGPARAGSGAAPRRGGLARTPRGGGRGGLRAAGGSDGPGALADEPRRESGPPSPSPESR